MSFPPPSLRIRLPAQTNCCPQPDVRASAPPRRGPTRDSDAVSVERRAQDQPGRINKRRRRRKQKERGQTQRSDTRQAQSACFSVYSCWYSRHIPLRITAFVALCTACFVYRYQVVAVHLALGMHGLYLCAMRCAKGRSVRLRWRHCLVIVACIGHCGRRAGDRRLPFVACTRRLLRIER